MSTATTTVPIRRELERDPIFIKDDKFLHHGGSKRREHSFNRQP
jgi:hypothetical protein